MRIAVIGAGVAGLAVANHLARAGLGCVVYEQATEIRAVGAGIQITPNAGRLLHRLGLAGALQRSGIRLAAMQMRLGKDNSVLNEVPLGDSFGAPHYTLHRADLHQALLSTLAPGTVRLGHRCTAVVPDGAGVDIGFDGEPDVHADLVIAADGVHSVARAAIVGDQPVFSGHTMYRGLVPAARVPALAAAARAVSWLGPGRHCVCYPVSAGEFVSFSATVPVEGQPAESWSSAGDPRALAAAYDGWTDELLGLLTAADEVSQWALYDREFVKSWWEGGVVLAGDAAHPLLPFMSQGANQAIEDAAVLVNCLRSAADVPAALRRYESLRQPRVEVIHAASRQNARILHSVELTPPDPARASEQRARAAEQVEWLFSYDADAASAVTR